MYSPLEPIIFDSIYKNRPLPSRMARCTPDTYAALFAVKRELLPLGADLILSDLFRSYEMQFQAHMDYVTGKKTAYSPPPGGSLHEAGRAFDLDLSKIANIGLKKFWKLASKHGVVPIIKRPDAGLSESWHFECRGSHSIVYDYYTDRKGDNFKTAYSAMAASAIISIGQRVDVLGTDPAAAYVQSGLIRLGEDIGDMDGRIGPKSRAALEKLGIDPNAGVQAMAEQIDRKLQAAFPTEFFIPGVVDEGAPSPPSHVIS